MASLILANVRMLLIVYFAVGKCAVVSSKRGQRQTDSTGMYDHRTSPRYRRVVCSTTVVDGFFVVSWIVVEIEHVPYLRRFDFITLTSSCSSGDDRALLPKPKAIGNNKQAFNQRNTFYFSVFLRRVR